MSLAYLAEAAATTLALRNWFDRSYPPLRYRARPYPRLPRTGRRRRRAAGPGRSAQSIRWATPWVTGSASFRVIPRPAVLRNPTSSARCGRRSGTTRALASRSGRRNQGGGGGGGDFAAVRSACARRLRRPGSSTGPVGLDLRRMRRTRPPRRHAATPSGGPIPLAAGSVPGNLLPGAATSDGALR